MGSPVPTRELGVTPHIELGRSVRLAALIDYRGGFRTYNFTERLRCVLVCADLYVSDVPLSRQARAVAPGRAEGEWIEDASFTRLREVSLSWTLPLSWSAVVGARAASLTLAGRNLATWTDYTGIDPEVTMYGPVAHRSAGLHDVGPAAYRDAPPRRALVAHSNQGDHGRYFQNASHASWSLKCSAQPRRSPVGDSGSRWRESSRCDSTSVGSGYFVATAITLRDVSM